MLDVVIARALLSAAAKGSGLAVPGHASLERLSYIGHVGLSESSPSPSSEYYTLALASYLSPRGSIQKFTHGKDR